MLDLLRLRGLWPSLSISSFLSALTAFKSTGQAFCRLSLRWDLSDAFLTIRRGKWHVPHVMSRAPRVSVTRHCWVDLGHPAEVCLSAVSTVKSPSSSEGSLPPCPARTGGLASCCPPLQQNVHVNWMRHLSVLLHSLTYPVIYILMSWRADISRCGLQSNTTLLFGRSNSPSSDGGVLSLSPSDAPT